MKNKSTSISHLASHVPMILNKPIVPSCSLSFLLIFNVVKPEKSLSKYNHMYDILLRNLDIISCKTNCITILSYAFKNFHSNKIFKLRWEGLLIYAMQKCEIIYNPALKSNIIGTIDDLFKDFYRREILQNHWNMQC